LARVVPAGLIIKYKKYKFSFLRSYRKSLNFSLGIFSRIFFIVFFCDFFSKYYFLEVGKSEAKYLVELGLGAIEHHHHVSQNRSKLLIDFFFELSFVNNENFVKKSKFCWQLEIKVKNLNFGQKSKIWSKI